MKVLLEAQSHAIGLGPGTHELKWSFSKNSDDETSDNVALDNLTISFYKQLSLFNYRREDYTQFKTELQLVEELRNLFTSRKTSAQDNIIYLVYPGW